MFPEILRGAIWHTTNTERFNRILEDGFILANPSISNFGRWNTARGPKYYPYVRSINGVSLFDFNDFDELGYSKKYPICQWRNFVPCLSKYDTAFWIEIDPDKIADNLISGKILLERWKQQKELQRNIMPIIEVAHIGSIPICAFRRVLNYSADTKDFKEVSF